MSEGGKLPEAGILQFIFVISQLKAACQRALCQGDCGECACCQLALD